MPRLPSARDVQKVSPRIGSDPGVDVPSAVFESPVGTLAQELAPAVEVLAQVARKQENRRDAVHGATLNNRTFEDFDAKLRELNTEEDLASEKVLQGFGAFQTEHINKSIEEYRAAGASEDNIARLRIQLENTASQFTGRAAALSAKLGRERVKTTFGISLSPLVQSASQDPSLENIDELFIGLETQIGNIKGALDPAEEDSFRQIGREQIALGAVDPLLARGRIEHAESLLDDGGLSQFLSPEKQREVRRKIESVLFARDETSRKITQAETVLGRDLTQDERLQILGLDIDRELTERQRRAEQLMARGLSPELSQDIAANDIRVVGPDQFGNFYSVNLVTNESNLVVGKDAEAMNNIVSEARPQEEAPQEEAPEGPTKLEQDVTKGTGPFAAIQAGISNVIGPFVEGAVFEDTTDSRQSVRLFAQTAKTGLINNPRFPVAEQNIVRELLPDADKFFVDPDRARADLGKMKEFLTDSIASKTKELNAGKITEERRGELTDQVSRIGELLSLMETPAEEGGEIQTVNSQEEVDQLESGTEFIWGPTNERFVKD